MERKPESERQVVEAWLAQIETCWKAIPEFEVDPERLAHLAIIADGNRTAAEEKGLDAWHGHEAGVEVIEGIMEASRKWGIKHLTFWVWSTENWKREEKQVDFVMNLASRHLRDEELISQLVENGVKFTHFGRKDRLPRGLMEAIADLEQRTLGNEQYYLNLAMDYGGADEVLRACARIATEVQGGRIEASQLLADPEIFYQFLDTGGQPFPDLVIRTGTREGEVPHTSGFMPIQTAYSGWMFLPALFPDLTPEILCSSITKFIGCDRRFGG